MFIRRESWRASGPNVPEVPDVPEGKLFHRWGAGTLAGTSGQGAGGRRARPANSRKRVERPRDA